MTYITKNDRNHPARSYPTVEAAALEGLKATYDFAELVSDPFEIRTKAIELAEELNHEDVYLELIRFLPSATIAEFIDHLRAVADIEDLI
jgi:hypothetical protein